MAKGRGSKSTKLLNKTFGSSATATATGANSIAGPSNPNSNPNKHSKISDELKQAVKDLGGDEDDLDLIDGIDESDNDDDNNNNNASSTSVPKVKGEKKSTDEKSLKKELGDFLKGLDFKAVGGAEVTSEDEEEEGEESEEEDVEGSDEEEEGEGDGAEGGGDAEEEDEDEEEDETEDEDEDEEEQASAQVESTTKTAIPEPAPIKPTSSVLGPEPTSGTNVPACSTWTNLIPELPIPEIPLKPIQGHALNELRQKAFNLLDNLPSLNRSSSSSDAVFINQILQSGTHQDKLSALILLVRESPVHALKELNRLRFMLGYKDDGSIGSGSGSNKDQRVAVMKALADWWTNGGGKSNGKLRYFADQPLLAHPQLTDRNLLMFAFEDYLKRWFFNLLQVLEVLSHDTLPFVRTQGLHIVFKLLSGNAEQEQNLLRLGVNKLGDTDRPVASKASHHILQLLQAHPAMKAVVAREVSALVLKPVGSNAAAGSGSTSSGSHIKFDDDVKSKKPVEKKSDTVNHARYYGLITLNQITLTRKDQEVAGKLVDLYFEVFREILGDGKKDEDEQGNEEETIGENQIEKVAGKVDKWRGRRKGTRGGKNGNNNKKTAIEQEEELIENSESKLVAAVLTGINRALPFAKLDETMFKSYMNTLFIITHKGTFNTSIQALNLIHQVSKSQSQSQSEIDSSTEIKSISDRYYRTLYDSLFDERLMTSSKQAMYLNLLFKSMKEDDRINRVMAFVKRLLQMLSLHQPPFICGALYLLGELFSATPGLKKMLIEPEDDDIEHFVDADRKDEPIINDDKKKTVNEKEYDGKKREPLYANADSSCLWDLVPFLNHFHPSVSLQANQLLLSQPLTGSSDISLNSLVSFLDRFVYRNPKKTLQPKGASIMQPAAVSDKSGMIIQNKGARSINSIGEAGLMVNSEQFWRKKVNDVPVEMLFFHKYFSEKLKRTENLKNNKGKKSQANDSDEEEEDDNEDQELPSDIAQEEDSDDDDDDNESELEEDQNQPEVDEEASDPEEDEIWKAMKASMPGADDDMGLSEDGDNDSLISDDMTEYSSDEDDDNDEEEDQSEDIEEDKSSEEEEQITTKKTKGKKRAVSPTSSESASSAFPDFDDEDDDLLSESDMPNIQLNVDDLSDKDEEEETKGGKRKRNNERKEKRKKRKELPTFGSYEDYQALIEAGGDEEED
ncbi:uncharacterized protein L201_007845 [Kwoniella dendrophila CBS 6074]|uniref:CCAAT-binding factor domain-containing protein n=1 Tax=Kwoniella dendrophila CBS 6074 TaxID=1295534 RepID=A0AAX4K715_9TREE